MVTKIEYKNYNDEVITSQQADLLISHWEYIYENNQLKKFVKYGPTSRTDKTKILWGGGYYLSENEDYQTIVNQYKDTGKSRFWYFYLPKQINAFGYYSIEWHKYEKGIIDMKRIEGYDSLNEQIMSCQPDTSSNQIFGKSKYLETPLIRQKYDSGLLIEYDDDNDTIIEKVVAGWEGDLTYYSIEDFIDSGINDVFNWDGNPYYHSFQPMLPSGIIV
jgi:hypothetical protein